MIMITKAPAPPPTIKTRPGSAITLFHQGRGGAGFFSAVAFWPRPGLAGRFRISAFPGVTTLMTFCVFAITGCACLSRRACLCGLCWAD